MVSGIECEDSANVAGSGPCHLPDNLNRATNPFSTRYQVQCMKIIVVGAVAGVFRTANYVDNSGHSIYHGSAGNTDLRADVVVRAIGGIGVACNDANILAGNGRTEVHLP